MTLMEILLTMVSPNMRGTLVIPPVVLVTLRQVQLQLTSSTQPLPPRSPLLSTSPTISADSTLSPIQSLWQLQPLNMAQLQTWYAARPSSQSTKQPVALQQ